MRKKPLLELDVYYNILLAKIYLLYFPVYNWYPHIWV